MAPATLRTAFLATSGIDFSLCGPLPCLPNKARPYESHRWSGRTFRCMRSDYLARYRDRYILLTYAVDVSGCTAYRRQHAACDATPRHS
ncbi:hypothetical protein B0H13DRAFT_2134214, partial [Mycena leptocephala]